MMQHKLSEFDFVFLSFDEPNAEYLYAELINQVPWAKRVHGVKGFDAAHRACADAADTNFFVTVDGDNSINPGFLDVVIDIADDQTDHAWSWSGRNHVNGLVYGNGGLKLWSKTFVYNMKSHENSEDAPGKVDFCWNQKYHDMFGTYSTSMINGNAYQAFRSGYREGVKMSLDAGKRVNPPDFSRLIWKYNLHKLLIWCSVGADVRNGIWSIFGARCGVYDCNLTDLDYTKINDYDWFQERYGQVKYLDPQEESAKIGEILRRNLNINIAELDAQQSKFFKNIYINPPRPLISYDQIQHLSANHV
jgi:hypothetical protein